MTPLARVDVYVVVLLSRLELLAPRLGLVALAPLAALTVALVKRRKG